MLRFHCDKVYNYINTQVAKTDLYNNIAITDAHNHGPKPIILLCQGTVRIGTVREYLKKNRKIHSNTVAYFMTNVRQQKKTSLDFVNETISPFILHMIISTFLKAAYI